jgi:hypothetical protein
MDRVNAYRLTNPITFAFTVQHAACGVSACPDVIAEGGRCIRKRSGPGDEEVATQASFSHQAAERQRDRLASSNSSRTFVIEDCRRRRARKLPWLENRTSRSQLSPQAGSKHAWLDGRRSCRSTRAVLRHCDPSSDWQIADRGDPKAGHVINRWRWRLTTVREQTAHPGSAGQPAVRPSAKPYRGPGHHSRTTSESRYSYGRYSNPRRARYEPLQRLSRMN